MEHRTLNELIGKLDAHGIPYFQTKYGVRVRALAPDFQYLKCRCDGDSPLVRARCQCGEVRTVCKACFDRGQIPRHRKDEDAKYHARICEPIPGSAWEEFDRYLVALAERLRAPIDFAALISQGLLERVSQGLYRLGEDSGYEDIGRLPQHVQDQITGYELSVGQSGKHRVLIQFNERPQV